MGDLEIIKINTGQRLTIAMDGTELRDQIPAPAIEWCDRGQHYASKLGGQDVADTLWICLTCQRG